MKKIFSILTLAIVISLFSSCIIVAHNDPDPELFYYNFYFFNDTGNDIRDWYLVDRNGNRYSKVNDGYANRCDAHEISSIKNLLSRDYYIFYEYEYDHHQITTGYFNLNSDTTFRLSNAEITSGRPRNAAE